jgi:hypothetical protein
MRTGQKIEKVFFLFQDEKHQLFLTLKKVLNEDETRRRKETDEMNIMYGAHSTPVLPIAGTIHSTQNVVGLKEGFERKPSALADGLSEHWHCASRKREIAAFTQKYVGK